MNEIILSQEEISKICKKIAKQITNICKNTKKPPVMIGVLKGAMPFAMEILKYIKMPIELDFVQYSSYIKKESSGMVVLKKDIETNIKGRDVIVVEDIVDTGRTLAKFRDYLEDRKPKSITTVTLLDKPSRRVVDFKPDIVGKEIEDKFVCGFGLDYQEFYRNTDHVFVVNQKQIKEIDELVKKISK